MSLIRSHVRDAEIVTTPRRAYMGQYECSPEDLTAAARDADVLMGWAVIPRQALESARSLRFIGWLHAGCDELDLEALRARGIQVSNVSGANAIPVAEQAFALLLALAKRVVGNNRDLVETRWSPLWDRQGASVELAGSTLAVIGLGRVGEEVAKRAKGFDMRVLGIKRDIAHHRGNADQVHSPDRLLEVLAEADFVVVTAPLTPETYHLIGEDQLRSMRRSAYLVNVSRGNTVHEGPLAKALTEGWIAGFAADVWWDYPDAVPPSYHFALPSRSNIHRMPSVVGSGDKAANTLKVKDRMIELGAESVAAFLAGKVPPRLVDLVKGY